MSQMTFDELIAITTVNDCAECSLRHAAVRTCEEAREWDNFKKGKSE